MTLPTGVEAKGQEGMTPFAGLLPSMKKGEPPNSQRWMAAR